MSNCKGSSHSNSSGKPATVTKSASDAGLQDSSKAETEKSEKLKEERIIPGTDSLKQIPPPHNAPNQAEIDSLKNAKTKAKVKGHK